MSSPINVDCAACGDSWQNENGEPCMECCPHDERDHGICLDCGHCIHGSHIYTPKLEKLTSCI